MRLKRFLLARMACRRAAHEGMVFLRGTVPAAEFIVPQ